MEKIFDPLTAAKICINFKTFGILIIALGFFLVSLTTGKYKILGTLEKYFNHLAKKRTLAILLVGLITFLGTAAVSFTFYWPTPSIEDEFAYLLAADTFAHGRITNPTHPMWIHFETFHVLQQPTYMAKYPPAQGLILALGQILTGDPVVGLWLSIALACAATCWMLQAWLPPRWALLGSLLMMLRLALFSYWGQSFWGGAVAAIGGALLFGSMKRILKKADTKNILIFGLGLAILANTRPYEGVVVGSITTIFMFGKLIREKRFPKKVLLEKLLLPLSIFLVVVAAMMGYYNWSITGNAFYLPYRAYEAAYGNIPNFLWAKPVYNATYNHEEIRKNFQVLYWNIYTSHISSLKNYLTWCSFKLTKLWRFFLEWVFTLPLIALILLRTNYWVRFALGIVLVLLIAMMLVAFNFGHYAAPVTCLLYFLVLQSIRRIYLLRWNKKAVGKYLAWSVPTYCVLIITLPIVLGTNPFFFVNPNPWEVTPRVLPTNWGMQRATLLSKLKEAEGKHLVIVRYLSGHNIEQEWVYNEANIDNSKVVWAREMNKENNCQLAKFFYDRKIWMLEIDDKNQGYNIYPINLCP